MKTVNVDLGPRSYPVVIGRAVTEQVADFLPPDASRFAVIEDAGVPESSRGILEERLRAIGEVWKVTVPGGEGSKSLAQANEVLAALADWPLRRGDIIVSIGGGATTDLAGFVASVYTRGVRVCHLPTTLLGQIDAAIGGKTGVNLAEAKNMVGTFHQPSAVLCDVGMLDSLPERHLRSGLAEVIKYGLCFNAGLLKSIGDEPLAALRKSPENLVFECVRIKGEVVSADERDRSVRAFLNYGHTLGHALESATSFSSLLHGEAISIGMVFAAELACLIGMIGEDEVSLHRGLLESAGLPISTDLPEDSVIPLLSKDKKFDKNQTWVLLAELQRPVFKRDVPSEAVLAAYSKVSHDG